LTLATQIYFAVQAELNERPDRLAAFQEWQPLINMILQLHRQGERNQQLEARLSTEPAKVRTTPRWLATRKAQAKVRRIDTYGVSVRSKALEGGRPRAAALLISRLTISERKRSLDETAASRRRVPKCRSVGETGSAELAGSRREVD
jgi:hypothetical protein